MRRVVAAGVVVPLLLVSAACSGGGETSAKVGTLKSITVSGSPSTAPEVSFEAPIRFTSVDSKVISHTGSGTDTVLRSSMVTVKYVGVNATDEGVFGSSWRGAGKPATFYVNSSVKCFADGLAGKHVGDRVLIVCPSKDAFGGTGNVQSTVRPGDSVIFVVDVLKVAPVQPAPPTAPQLQYDAQGNPSKFTATDQVTAKPTQLGVYTLIQGPGPKLQAGDRVSINYFGQIYPAGKVFNAWTGQPFEVKLGVGQVIKGWDQALVGQRVGSRIELVIPPALAYGNKSQAGIPANSTLVFALQIVGVN